MNLNIRLDVHHHHRTDDNSSEVILKSIIQLTQTLKKIMAGIDELKQKIQAQSDALDAVNVSVSGIEGDISFLKDKLSQLPDGASAEQLAELDALLTGLGEKVATIGTATAALDAGTDSAGPDEPEAEEPTEPTTPTEPVV